ncbi:MAG TPA: hypothetical protein VFZ76_17650 [Anaerolineales bacterium]
MLVSLACNFPPLYAQRQVDATLPAPVNQTPAVEHSPIPEHTEGPSQVTPAPQATFVSPGENEGVYTYLAQSGDTLSALASHFGVETDQVTSTEIIPPEGYLSPGQVLYVPNVLDEVLSSAPLLPDSEVIYSPTTVGFRIDTYIAEAGGYLSTYDEEVDGQRMSGTEIVQRVAVETSTNPRLLLAFLEYRSRWVTGQPENSDKEIYPLGFYVPGYRGLYKELSLAAKQLNIGYYGWRLGTLTELLFPDGSIRRLNPNLNAGSVALQYLFSKFYRPNLWEEGLYSGDNFLLLHSQMFGNAWERAAAIEPLLTPQIDQPELALPFLPGERWSFTGGPHISWNTGTPSGGLDFSPVTGDPPCSVSSAWVTASGSGVVVRSEHDSLMLDLDGDGYEQTGWVLFYLHVAERDRVPAGTQVSQDDRLGHPSCEGGTATGTHLHLARKYNGEWLPADGPVPFTLSGWRVANGSRYYEGYLIKGDEMVAANPGGSRSSIIVRSP